MVVNSTPTSSNTRAASNPPNTIRITPPSKLINRTHGAHLKVILPLFGSCSVKNKCLFTLVLSLKYQNTARKRRIKIDTVYVRGLAMYDPSWIEVLDNELEILSTCDTQFPGYEYFDVTTTREGNGRVYSDLYLSITRLSKYPWRIEVTD